MKPRAIDDVCPHFQTAMTVLSRPWNGLVLALLGETARLRFSELRERLPIGDRMLALRLKELEARGLVLRHVDAGPPVRVDYELTEVGRAFRHVATALSDWGVRVGRAQAPVKAGRRPRR